MIKTSEQILRQSFNQMETSFPRFGVILIKKVGPAGAITVKIF